MMRVSVLGCIFLARREALIQDTHLFLIFILSFFFISPKSLLSSFRYADYHYEGLTRPRLLDYPSQVCGVISLCIALCMDGC